MPPTFTDIVEDARLAAQSLLEYAGGFLHPTVRLGVTGLTRSGKTVFLTALIHNLLHGGRLPVFEAMASGRIARARLEPQPDDAVPRFDYETHVARAGRGARLAGVDAAASASCASSIDYQSASGRARTLTLDIVDYPGEWLLDLPLLTKSYAEWSAETWRCRGRPPRRDLAGAWHAHLATPAAGGSRGRAGGARGGAAVHRLSAGLPRRALRP